MFGELNASQFKHRSNFYGSEFESLLSKIIVCYEKMSAHITSLPNKENEIRDVLLIDYLNDNKIRNEIGLKNYLFDPEVPEGNEGRTDIKIQTKNTFEDTAAYYIIECKRLDTKSKNWEKSLNSEYVNEGIARFVSKKYSTYYKVNGMIGFIVEAMDINENIIAINSLLNGNLNTSQVLHYHEIAPNFDFSYRSTHNLDKGEIAIYHLMFDFSQQIGN
jgi:hypothetical protein